MTIGQRLLFVNVLVYYMLHRMRLYSNIRVENEILKQQNECFRLGQKEFEKQWFLLNKVRHDLKNNCVLEMSYLEEGEYDLLMAHYRKQIGEMGGRDQYIYTGNIGIDSIVNYKLNIAKELQITVKKTIQITGKVWIDSSDLNTLIGNLMDNAIEAVGNLDIGKRKIELIIRNDKTAFFLEINNFFKGERTRDKEGDYLTGKSDKMRHGIGLKAVKGVVRKYDGQMIIDSKNSKFNIKVLIYMDSQL